MDEKTPDNVTEPQAPEQAPIAPVHESEDAKQFSKWMLEYGRPALIGLAVAVVLLLGMSVWRSQKASNRGLAVAVTAQQRDPVIGIDPQIKPFEYWRFAIADCRKR